MRAPFILFALVLFSGCASSQLSESEENYLTTIETPATVEKGGAKQKTSLDVQKREWVKFIVHVSDIGQPFTTEDAAFFRRLPNSPTNGSFQEAAAVVGALRLALDESQWQRYQEEDLLQQNKNNSAPAVPPKAETSLEAIAQTKGIEIDKALERNTIIKNFRVYHMAQQALQKTKNSDDFNNRVNLVIQTEARTWASLIPIPNTPLTPLPEQPVPQPPKRRLSTQDLRGGDAAVMQADELAEQGQYKEAIELLNAIDQSDPYYATAQEKIRLLSNRAVQALRQRAAKAFQSSIPLTETSQKIVLLEEAKKLLEEALNQYPGADQLGTVQENLAVINRDLKNLGR